MKKMKSVAIQTHKHTLIADIARKAGLTRPIGDWLSIFTSHEILAVAIRGYGFNGSLPDGEYAVWWTGDRTTGRFPDDTFFLVHIITHITYRVHVHARDPRAKDFVRNVNNWHWS
jgi:hypothetical protein